MKNCVACTVHIVLKRKEFKIVLVPESKRKVRNLQNNNLYKKTVKKVALPTPLPRPIPGLNKTLTFLEYICGGNL